MMMVPHSLLEIQKWLGKMILQPLQKDQRIPDISPFGTNIKEETEKYIAPSWSLEPYQRVEIYHQQYWWRLLKAMHENYPFLTRLFGYEPFNRTISIPFLTLHPPFHWALSKLGNTLPEWLHEYYHEEDRYLVIQVALIDRAAQYSFSAKFHPPVDFSKIPQEEILLKEIKLQPHIHLFELEGDLFNCREMLLEKEVEYWNTHPFPEVQCKKSYFVLYRSPENTVKWKELSIGEYKMLSYFRNACSVNDALEKIEIEAPEEAEEKIALWFHEWTYLKWFSEV